MQERLHDVLREALEARRDGRCLRRTRNRPVIPDGMFAVTRGDARGGRASVSRRSRGGSMGPDHHVLRRNLAPWLGAVLMVVERMRLHRRMRRVCRADQRRRMATLRRSARNSL
eukprot:scaffold326077_cov61-Tisochrysis_lutea.AAC.2